LCSTKFDGDCFRLSLETCHSVKNCADLRDPSVLVGAIAICIEYKHKNCFQRILRDCGYWFEKDRLFLENTASFLLGEILKSKDMMSELFELIDTGVVGSTHIFYQPNLRHVSC